MFLEHICRLVRVHLSTEFSNRWIIRGSQILQPVVSPNINFPKFEILSYMKSLVFYLTFNSRNQLGVTSAAASFRNEQLLFNIRSSINNGSEDSMEVNGCPLEQPQWTTNHTFHTVLVTEKCTKEIRCKYHEIWIFVCYIVKSF